MTYNNYNDEDIQSFEYEKTINSDGEIAGSCELGKATIQLLNDNNKYSNYKDSWISTVHGSFYIHDIKPVQENVNIKFECYDIKYKLDTKYNSSLYTWPMTLKQWRNQILINCGLNYDDTDFPNCNLILQSEPYICKNPSNRNAISKIAQAGYSFVDNDENDVIYFKWFENNVHIVDDWIELTSEKEASSEVNCVVLGRGDVEDNVKYPSITPENQVEFRIDNNYILDPQDTSSNQDRRRDVIQSLYYRVNGFSYVVFKLRTQEIENKLSIKLGEKIRYSDIYDNEIETYIMSIKINYLGGAFNNDNNYEITLSSEEIKETSTDLSYAGNLEEEITKVDRKADKINGQIQDVISQVNGQNQKISEVTQTVDEINQKISDIADITISGESEAGVFTLENINASEPIMIKVRPIVENISYLYPNDNLFPSDLLYLKDRKIRFTNLNEYIQTTDSTYQSGKNYYTYDSQNDSYTLLEFGTDYTIDSLISGTKYENKYYDYLLPNDLLYYNSEVYDEYILDYDNQICQVIKRCGYNADGSVNVLEFEEKIDYEYPSIQLADGDYKIQLLGYNQGYLFVRLMAKNIYTTQFYTKSETRSLIDQKADQVIIDVTQILSNYSTTQEMNAAITVKANEINQTVSLKLNSSEYTHASIVAKINDNTSSALIEADKINITASDVLNILANNSINITSKNIGIKSTNFSLTPAGKITANVGVMGGWTLSSSGLINEDGDIFLRSNGYSNIYTYTDIVILRNYLLGKIDLSETDIREHYDLTGDGTVDSADLVRLRRMILNLS